VLRRIIRRAIRHGYKLGQTRPFFHKLVGNLSQVMGEAYPELPAAQHRVTDVLKQEEERFAETLENGMKVLENALHREDRMLDGATVFQLYDTFGFPVDLTADIARERGVMIDHAGFEAAMERQRERARAASKFTMQAGMDYSGQATEFHGYDTLRLDGRIVALYKGGTPMQKIEAGDEAVIVLDRTPFYAESGGQIGDQGEITSGNGSFTVNDTQKIQAEVFGHKGVLKAGHFTVGDAVTAQVNPATRTCTAYNHSATHLMHAALRKVLGPHVTQKGSLVAPDRLRFDFSHPKPLTEDDLRAAEAEVNARIRRNAAVGTRFMTPDEAVAAGAIALFGEKYGDEVRVVAMGGADDGQPFSTELCGGTHARRTGDIGLFKIVAEGAVAAGLRRIEALTGAAAEVHVGEQERTLARLAAALKTQPAELPARLAGLLEERRRLERELAEARRALATGGTAAGPMAKDVAGVRLAARLLDGVPAKELKSMADALKKQIGSGVVALAARGEGRASLVVAVTDDLTDRFDAVELARLGGRALGGQGGGGRPDMAQAGGPDGTKAEAALAAIERAVAEAAGAA
ncbi:MAG TPA: alanine--tRNA ligase, partial [Dongiaceae bacterium]|nr:alanine--tRNA ligase [Dongiaceae bacterium]